MGGGARGRDCAGAEGANSEAGVGGAELLSLILKPPPEPPGVGRGGAPEDGEPALPGAEESFLVLSFSFIVAVIEALQDKVVQRRPSMRATRSK